MKASEYIISSIKEWQRVFPEMDVRYAYDIRSHFHIIEVSPGSSSSLNEEYAALELNFWDEFLRDFPEEELLISEPDIRNDMSNQLYPCEVAQTIVFDDSTRWEIWQSSFNMEVEFSHLPKQYSFENRSNTISFDVQYITNDSERCICKSNYALAA